VILILFGSRQLPTFVRGLAKGLRRFRKHSVELAGEIDRDAHEAGESLGGIYGKPAAEALTPNNSTAEFYDPAAFHKQGTTSRTERRKGYRALGRFIWSMWHFGFKRHR